MKNNIFFKLLAVLLCASSLMGLVGGAAGALVLAEGDLYNKTVDQVIDQRIAGNVAQYADQIALEYASRELGGCPEELTQRYNNSNWFQNAYPNNGYTILDAEGKVLAAVNAELKDNVESYSIPVSGQYMHLVSTESESQLLAQEAEARMAAYDEDVLADLDGETVPPEGIAVNHVVFTNSDGSMIYEAFCDGSTGYSTYFYSIDIQSSNYDHPSNSSCGFLFYNQADQLMYHSFLAENEEHFVATVYSVFFHNAEKNFTFQLENPDGLGTLVNENGHLLFTAFSTAPKETAEETVPVTVPEETEAETQPEILPDEEEPTADSYAEETEEQVSEEEEYSEETEEYSEEEYTDENEPSSASANPEEYDGEPAEEDADYQDETSEEAAGENTPQDEDHMKRQQLERKIQERILFEWLLSNGLISETELPADQIPDQILYEWLIDNELISKVPDPDKAAPEESVPQKTALEETVPEIPEPVMINGKPLDSYQINRSEYRDPSTGEKVTAKYVYLPMPELTVEVYADRSTMQDAQLYNVLRILRQYRSYLLPVIGICLLLFAVSVVYLCTAAGRKPRTEEVRAGGLNRLSLDFYLFGGGFAITGIAALGIFGAQALLPRDFMLGCSLAIAAAFACCLFFVGFIFAFVAQIKTPGGFWWRNTLTVRCVLLLSRFGKWLKTILIEKVFPFLSRLLKKIWQMILKCMIWLYKGTEKMLHRIGNLLHRFLSLMPVTWQWILAGIVMVLSLWITAASHMGFGIVLAILLAFALILYGAHCFGTLLESTKKMGKGDLDTKVDDNLMIGSFKEFAGDLNDLADVAVVAAQKQLKSERMKTELITNVSHDIKTPLTSIINYVDLLQKPHSQEEQEQYLEVLDRQSQRLKKLIDDLMDMSKANTGNMAVEISKVDAVESVNQALGEFSDKLDRAQLIPVFRHSEDRVAMWADGKLVWRVLSNLLGNAVKYAMPGTRMYLDLMQMDGKVILSLKNISREELNINAEELMERFVRGDVSRNTEGSGLGLNIAKSLMELQKGQLQLLVDGDLFKVTLIFPSAE